MRPRHVAMPPRTSEVASRVGINAVHSATSRRVMRRDITKAPAPEVLASRIANLNGPSRPNASRRRTCSRAEPRDVFE